MPCVVIRIVTKCNVRFACTLFADPISRKILSAQVISGVSRTCSRINSVAANATRNGMGRTIKGWLLLTVLFAMQLAVLSAYPSLMSSSVVKWTGFFPKSRPLKTVIDAKIELNCTVASVGCASASNASSKPVRG